MRRAVMKLVLESFTSWLTDRLPPSGKPFAPDLKAECIQLIDFVPGGSGPDVPGVESLTEDSLRGVYEWLFTTLVAANPGSRAWGLAAHSLRLHALEHLPDLLRRIQNPPHPIGGDAEKVRESPGGKGPPEGPGLGGGP